MSDTNEQLWQSQLDLIKAAMLADTNAEKHLLEAFAGTAKILIQDLIHNYRIQYLKDLMSLAKELKCKKAEKICKIFPNFLEMEHIFYWHQKFNAYYFDEPGKFRALIQAWAKKKKDTILQKSFIEFYKNYKPEKKTSEDPEKKLAAAYAALKKSGLKHKLLEQIEAYLSERRPDLYAKIKG